MMPETRSVRTPRRTRVAALGFVFALVGWLLAAPAAPVTAAPLHVTSCADAGTNTLRGRIAAAVGDTIVFDQDCTITLATGTLTLTRDVTIDGAGRSVVVDGGCTANCGTQSAAGGVTVFTVNGGVTAALNALTIRHGNAATNGGGISNGGTLTVTSSTLTGNSAPGVFGGGIYNNNTGTLTVTNSTFTANSAAKGGGIYTTLGTVTVTNSTLSGNTATLGGDGIYTNGGTVTVTSSTLSGNTGSSGCGIYNNTGTVTVTNSTLTGNTSTLAGGGIYNSSGGLTVTNSTLSGNSATLAGGGIYNNGGSVEMGNTIIAGNTAPNGPDIFGSVSSDGHNLIGNTSGALIHPGPSDLVTPTPRLGTLGNNGGPTQTMALLPGSPALDAGDDAVCASTTIPAGAAVGGKDQRGVDRSQGAHCDIGAFEARFTLAVSGGTPQFTAPSRPFAQPLTVTLGGLDAPADRTGAPVTFTVQPVGGASATLGAPNPATTDVAGRVGVGAAANGTLGTYTVTASTSGAAVATFTLTNAAANPLPGAKPSGSVGGPPPPLPAARPPGTTGGLAPNPLPVSRP